LRHVVSEIDDAKLRPGEDEALQTEARRLSQATALAEQAARIADSIDGGNGAALSQVTAADKALGQLEKNDPSVTSWRELLDGAHANLSELARVASEYAGSVEEDPARLQEVEARRDLLFRLRQKHGTSIEAVLAVRAEGAAELELLDTADTDLRAIA